MLATEPVESHEVQSRQMLDLAAKMVACGDRRQAAMQIWEAAARRVGEIAEARGWPNRSHADGWAIIGYLADQSGDERIGDLFALASHARQNSYEDWRTLEEVARLLEHVSELFDLLDEAHRTLPADLPMPDEPFYRQRHASGRER